MLHIAANALWYLLCVPESLAFHRARRDVAGSQRELLLRLLRRNADTDFGRRHGFGSIRSAAEYQARVPLSTYDDYREAIARIGADERAVLTRDRVLLLELTSGSTAPTKLIPYTAALKAEFGRAVAPWIVDLYSHQLPLFTGQAYWSVTPVTRRNERTPGGIPVGFEEDSEYFGRLQGALIRSIQAVPPLVRLIDDMDAFRYVTLLFLLRSRALTLISVWNPTFLILLVNRLAGWWPRLAGDISRGTLSPPTPLAPDLQAQLTSLLRPDPRRAAEIRAAATVHGETGALHARLWPRLRLVSCWADGHAERYAAELARLFPQARLQGKGLLATEGVVSFPLTGYAGAALALRSHFFEFLPADAQQGSVTGDLPVLAHQLETGGCYAVVLTTGGGLYRYQLHDLVEITGRHGACPLLRFLGKGSHISDHFGEKLNERHVQGALDTLLARFAVAAAFAMVALEGADGGPAYTLFIETNEPSDETLRRLGWSWKQPCRRITTTATAASSGNLIACGYSAFAAAGRKPTYRSARRVASVPAISRASPCTTPRAGPDFSTERRCRAERTERTRRSHACAIRS